MKAQTLVPLAAAAAAQLLVVGNIAAAFAFQQKPPVETLVTVPVVAEIEQVECVRQDPVPYEPVTCVEEQKPVAACWREPSAPRRQWKIVHKYKVEYRSPVSNRELLKKSYVWAVSAEEAVGYAKENVGISGLIVNAEESNESDS